MFKDTPLDKVTKLIAGFVGSWWGVFVHTIWFLIWIILDFSIANLSLIVSLEAIFIGIFLLMYSSKAEIRRDLAHSQKQAKILSETVADVAMNKEQLKALTQIQKDLADIKQTLLQSADAPTKV